jgi:hypothetical protein
VAVLDRLRPPTVRTHLGRFVQQVQGGQAGTVLARKAAANLHVLAGSPLTLLLGVSVLAAAWLVRPGGLLRGGVLPAVLRPGLTATALALGIGALVNDSGVAVPATAAAVLVPLATWLAAGVPAAPEGVADGPAGGGAGGSRVTVVSRGSVVRNA